MKTLYKLQLAAALMALSVGANAQSGQRKTSINMDIIVDGKETKIDTSFTIPGLDSLQDVLKGFNLEAMSKDLAILRNPMPGAGFEIDTAVGEDAKHKSIMIRGAGANGKQEYVKITSGEDGESTVIVNRDEEGNEDTGAGVNTNSYNYAYTDGGNSKVIAKSSKNGSCTIIINEKDSNDKGKSEKIKVIVFKDVEINNISDEDKKELPKDVTKKMDHSKPFADLVLSPNPTDGNLRITYKSTSDELLTIRVFNTAGRNVLAYTYDGLTNDVDKTISLSNLSKGVYFVQLTQGKQSEVRKVVVN